MVVTCFHQMPQVIDHAGGDECLALVVKGDPPGVARSFAEHLEFAGPGMNPIHRNCEWPTMMLFIVVRVRLRVI
jgi:hypothetical protein